MKDLEHPLKAKCTWWNSKTGPNTSQVNADVHCAHMQFETELLVDESLFQIMPGTMENADGEQVFSRKILSFKAILV